MFCSRILLKRWVLAIIFVVSLTYFIINVRQSNYEPLEESDRWVQAPQVFQWQPKLEDNSTKISSCRNSVQGKLLLADDRGYVCQRADLSINGCCNIYGPSSKRHSCETCQENGCCAIYEYCISCCLQPDKKPLLQNILGKVPETFRALFSSVTDLFELCLAKCRTSSQSVQHENSYRDPKAKHCYGKDPPSLHASIQ